MGHTDIDHSVITGLLNLLPLFQKKLMKPVELLSKETLSPLQHFVLMSLKESRTLTMSEISKEVYISKPQLTPIIDKLIQLNMIKREVSEKDRRMINIYITDAGLEYIHEKDIEIYEVLKKKFELVAQDDLLKLNGAIQVIHNIFQNLP